MNPRVQIEHGDGGVTTIPTWLWATVGVLLMATTGAIGTWAGSTLMDHDRAIVMLQGQMMRAERDIASVEVKFDRIWSKLEQLDR